MNTTDNACKIVAVIVAVDYDGELAVMLPHIRNQADHVYIVTKPDAYNTHGIAVANECSILAFDGWHEHGAKFNKAGALRAAQLYARNKHPDAWELILDADIVVPSGLREIVACLPYGDDAIYAAHRVDYHDDAAIENASPSWEYPRIPAGFFQLHQSARLYAEWSESAERCDIDFAVAFADIRMLPIVCHHLGKEGQNWKGRMSPAWIPRAVYVI